ncbi:response regulator [Thiomicrorhabdus xiamenensis]|uniref:Response regulator n=1 Tax=Thiomicrorhabdus xiamenensis TaxID=2739063 RepID=A0A7D4NPM7_9GAMM|nr:response regulator [Thiomicrorhabdus xiamenensis]QKI88551.1 response regulator [Thiomicrorhabdus xiamenensis]
MSEPLKVLLVDDDPALRGMVAFALEAEGYDVDEAESQQSAKEAFENYEYPIVVLDMGMPPNEHTTKEGVDVLNWIGIYHPMTLVIVLTGQDAKATSYEVLKEGAFDFLEKPISESALVLAVKRAVLFYEQNQKLRADEGIQKMQINAPMGEGVKPVRNQAEEKMLRQILADTNFNVHESARRLGLKRENVYYLIKKYNIERPEYE